MITFKPGVECTKIQVVIFEAMLKVARIYSILGVPELVVTSLRDGNHMAESKHYEGLAFDCRIWTIHKDHREPCYQAMRQELGAAYDVVREKKADGTDSHFHVEYDPD